MAGGHSDYSHGSMVVDAQAGTFSGFMGGTKYGATIIALVVLMPTLVFALGMSWVLALFATVVFGFALGAILKFKGVWFVSVISAAIFTAIVSFGISLIA